MRLVHIPVVNLVLILYTVYGCTGCTGQNTFPTCHHCHNYVAYGCTNDNKIGYANDYYVLDGRRGNAPPGHCSIWDTMITSHHCFIWDTMMPVPHENYVVTAQFYPLHGDTLNSDMIGYNGLVFNQQDEHNYDFFHVRILPGRMCYVRGCMTSASHTLYPASTHDCINRPQQKTWFTLRAEISGNSVTAFIDGVVAETFTAYHPRMGRAAVMVWNGNNNVVLFKNFNVLSL